MELPDVDDDQAVTPAAASVQHHTTTATRQAHAACRPVCPTGRKINFIRQALFCAAQWHRASQPDPGSMPAICYGFDSFLRLWRMGWTSKILKKCATSPVLLPARNGLAKSRLLLPIGSRRTPYPPHSKTKGKTVTGIQKLIVVFIIVGVVLALIKLFRVFNSSNGERYMRMRTQGPFVPLDANVGESKETDTAPKP
jgi:hypothetical protein